MIMQRSRFHGAVMITRRSAAFRLGIIIVNEGLEFIMPAPIEIHVTLSCPCDNFKNIAALSVKLSGDDHTSECLDKFEDRNR